MKKYYYFGKNKANAMVPLFEAVAEVDPTPAEVKNIYHELVRQSGLNTPRPTHYAAMELHEIPVSDETDNKPMLLQTDGIVN